MALQSVAQFTCGSGVLTVGKQRGMGGGRDRDRDRHHESAGAGGERVAFGLQGSCRGLWEGCGAVGEALRGRCGNVGVRGLWGIW